MLFASLMYDFIYLVRITELSPVVKLLSHKRYFIFLLVHDCQFSFPTFVFGVGRSF